MSKEVEEEEQTLEEKITSLRQQGLSDEEAVRTVFREDFNTDVSEICRITGMEKLVVGRIKGQVSRWLKRQEKPTEEAKEAPPETVYKTEPDANAILDEILSTHPEITPKIKAEIMDWAKRKGSLDPGFLAWLLSSFRGMTQTTANVVSQKYALALQRAQQEGRIQLPTGFPMWPPQQQQPPMGFPVGFPQQPPGTLTVQQPPYVPQFGAQQQFPSQTSPGWGYPPPLTEERIRSIIREERERQAKEPRESEQYVEIEDPVRDNTGNVILDPQDRPIMKKMRVPVSQASQFVPREDVEGRDLTKMRAYKELFGSKEELTEEKIRAIIKDEMPSQPRTPAEKPITLEDVKKVSTEASQAAVTQVLEAHEKEDKDERRHQETIAAIHESGSARTVGDYRDDSYRFMGQSLHEVAGVARDKKPVELAARVIFGEPSSPKEVAIGAGEGLLRRLKERGWVVEQ